MRSGMFVPALVKKAKKRGCFPDAVGPGEA